MSRTKDLWEAKARADGWITEEEKYPGPHAHYGVVHPEGWWAPDWECACSKSLTERAEHAAYETHAIHYGERT